MLARFAEGIADHLLQLDPSSLEKLAELSGRVVKVELKQSSVYFYLLPDQEGIRIEREVDREPDLLLRGSFSTLISFFHKGRFDPEGGSLYFQGDPELGNDLGAFFEHLDLDWEEGLSRFIGDTPATKVGNGVRGFADRVSQARESVERNVAEYFQEELRSLPAPPEIESFSKAVIQLEQRVTLLQQRVEKAVRQ